MNIFKKILCPVDFSEYSVLALRYATALARDNDTELIVYHSVPDLTPAMSYLEGEFLLTVSDALLNNAKSNLDSWIKNSYHQIYLLKRLLARAILLMQLLRSHANSGLISW